MTSDNTWTWIDEKVVITPKALAEVMAKLTPRIQGRCASFELHAGNPEFRTIINGLVDCHRNDKGQPHD